MAKGVPTLCSYSEIFRNETSDHVGSFDSFLEEGNALLAELNATMMAIELAFERN